jgi:DNA mismatch endonuclease (patch repair protein)
MADVFSKLKRSQVMAAIRSRGNKDTELILVAVLRSNRITGWRRHPMMTGRPDFVFRRERVAVFVDGCFWHGCPVHCRMPKSRVGFWRKKITGNQARDRRVSRALRKGGWAVIRIWEHALAYPDSVARKVKAKLGLRRIRRGQFMVRAATIPVSRSKR